jgi:Tfp pilus assembly protein PilN
MRAVNLIPSEQRGGGTVGARSGGAVFLVLGLLGGLIVLAFLYGSSHHELQSRRTEAAALSARAAQVQAQAAQLAPYASFMTLREQRLHSISQLIGGRFDWSNAMGELSRVLPHNVSLSTLVGTIGGSEAASAKAATPAAGAGTVSSATPPGAVPSITLSGCAGSQSTVAQMLVRLRLISGVSSVALQSSTKPGGGSSSSSSSSASTGPCTTSDPVFSVVVNFEPLPAAATPSVQALTSPSSATTTKGAKRTAALSTGGRLR